MTRTNGRQTAWATLSATLAWSLTACGGGGGGAAVQDSPQVIQVNAVPAQVAGSTLSIQASASSGLSVSYTSTTPAVCQVSASGLVSMLDAGTCMITLSQGGNGTYAAAAPVTVSFVVASDRLQSLRWGLPPVLSLGGTATVVATASSGLAAQYSSLTPGVCSVSAQGVVTDLTAGDCLIAADQPGDARHDAATRLTLTLSVVVPDGLTVPAAPAGVAVRLGTQAHTIVVSATSTDSGGSPITAYTVRSQPSGVQVVVSSLPATVSCGGSCAGLAFTVSASNAVGEGAASASTHVITTLSVTTVFYEPDTQPNDSIFIGTLALDSTTGTVTGLQGRLSESMTGGARGYPQDTMTWLSLSHPLKSWHDDTLGGTFVATFLNADDHTFMAGNGDAWSPAQGVDVGGVYFGYPTRSTGVANPGNAYALIFVPDDPLQALTTAQLNRLAYADCAPGGMMGAVCMTGTSVDGYGAVGTMGGTPASQTLSVVVP